MTCTRPDICWVITKLSQYLSKPLKEHWVAVKHVLQYLKCTVDHELCYRKCAKGLTLIAYSDADWASSTDSSLDTSMYPMRHDMTYSVLKVPLNPNQPTYVSNDKPINVLSYEVFLLICTHVASTSNFGLVASLATLGNSGNLHKSKMAARRHNDNTILEVFILE